MNISCMVAHHVDARSLSATSTQPCKPCHTQSKNLRRPAAPAAPPLPPDRGYLFRCGEFGRHWDKPDIARCMAVVCFAMQSGLGLTDGVRSLHLLGSITRHSVNKLFPNFSSFLIGCAGNFGSRAQHRSE